MIFSKEFLQEFEGETISDELYEKTRWSVCYERIFKHDDKFYRTFYSVGATESQDEHPYEYDDEQIECEEVFPTQVITTVYKSKKQLEN
jgi:hypothetical protein